MHCGQDMGKESQLCALTCGPVAKALTLPVPFSNEGMQDP